MIRIDVLPDDVLLEIFDFYMVLSISYEYLEDESAFEAWQQLVHVCRRWRCLVFGSPRRLDLRLRCTYERSTKSTLDVWPALPLVIDASVGVDEDLEVVPGMDNVVAALEQSNRVCQVKLHVGPGLAEELGEILAAMQVPFPELTQFELADGMEGLDDLMPVIPDSFLGGSAPRLQSFQLFGFSFPGLPNLLLSATHLVELCLYSIPHSGYISPEAIAAALSVLSNLEILQISFPLTESRPVSESPSLSIPKRSILPALSGLAFQGVTGYLEQLVIRIDTPRLHGMDIRLFNQIGTPRLAQFINRTSLGAGDKAYVDFHDDQFSAKVKTFEILNSCSEPDQQLSSIAQFYNPLRSLSTVERLDISCQCHRRVWKNDAIQNTLWLQLLLPFTAVKEFRLSRALVPSIAATLNELVGSRIIEVLPSLQNILVDRPEQSGALKETFGHFVAARQLYDRPVRVSISGFNCV